LLAVARSRRDVETMTVLKGAPWAIVFFAIGMYVVVYGLRNVGLASVLAQAIEWTAGHGLYASTIGMGFIAASLASGMDK
ncbi:ArsB/NhaD family transporter, partial [Planococcus sp. SIMBA_143]